MFLNSDPQTHLDLHHQRSGELIRQAAQYRAAREARAARSTGNRRKWVRLPGFLKSVRSSGTRVPA